MKRGEEEKKERGERRGRRERERREREEREREMKKSMYILGHTINRCKVISAKSMQVQYYILYQFRCESTSPKFVLHKAFLGAVTLSAEISRSPARISTQRP